MSDQFLPPHNIEAEQFLLGVILYENTAMAHQSLEPEHFYDPLHGRIFKAAQARINEGRPATSVTLRAVFADEEPISEGLSVVQYLERLESNVTPGAINHFYEHAVLIKELAANREIIAIAQEMMSQARSALFSPAELVGDMTARLDDIIAAHRIERKTVFSIDDSSKEAIVYACSQEGEAPVSSGFKDLDERIGGFYRGQLTILAARPSMGKSAVSIAMALNAAATGKNVLYFSLEMTAMDLSSRCLTDKSWRWDEPIAYKDLRRRKVDEEGIRRLYQDGHKKIADFSLYIDEKPGLRITDILSRARRHAQQLERKGQKLDLLVIDHLGKIRPSSRYAGNSYGEKSEISARLAEMAKMLDVPVLALHQLSRAIEQRDNKRPLMSDLRDSGKIEEDADNIMFVYREAYYLERLKHKDPSDELVRLAALDKMHNRLEIIVAKQRAGQTGAPVTLFADMQSNAIRDLEMIEGRAS